MWRRRAEWMPGSHGIAMRTRWVVVLFMDLVAWVSCSFVVAEVQGRARSRGWGACGTPAMMAPCAGLQILHLWSEDATVLCSTQCSWKTSWDSTFHKWDNMEIKWDNMKSQQPILASCLIIIKSPQSSELSRDVAWWWPRVRDEKSWQRCEYLPQEKQNETDSYCPPTGSLHPQWQMVKLVLTPKNLKSRVDAVPPPHVL